MLTIQEYLDREFEGIEVSLGQEALFSIGGSIIRDIAGHAESKGLKDISVENILEGEHTDLMALKAVKPFA